MPGMFDDLIPKNYSISGMRKLGRDGAGWV